MRRIQYDRHILALSDTDLEIFVHDWINSKTKEYYQVERFSGSGDFGRDVVGFVTSSLHEGEWDNYQCKQYSKRLPTDKALIEIGKTLYYAHQGNFQAPRTYNFVVPKGINRNLETLIFNPNKFKDTLIKDWDQKCSDKIIENKVISLDLELERFIRNYDFSRIKKINLNDILQDACVKSVLYQWFDADPGPAPEGEVPENIQEKEMHYIKQLLDAYGEREGTDFPDHQTCLGHKVHGPHFSLQRERFYDADAFKRFYRDNTDPKVIDSFEKEIFSGVIDICSSRFSDALEKLNNVMSQAAKVQTSGTIAKHARVPTKQGFCHHFANEDRIKWKV